MSKKIGADDKTNEGRFLDRHPDVRSQVLSNTDFRHWLNSLRSVVIDEEKFYVRGGDMLVDEDQVVYEWASSKGIVASEAAFGLAEESEPEDQDG